MAITRSRVCNQVHTFHTCAMWIYQCGASSHANVLYICGIYSRNLYQFSGCSLTCACLWFVLVVACFLSRRYNRCLTSSFASRLSGFRARAGTCVGLHTFQPFLKSANNCKLMMLSLQCVQVVTCYLAVRLACCRWHISSLV